MRPGFTLIELLVVMTIIVVLIALLVPALDRAVYQAELAVCGANQRATAGGAAHYAADFQRRYPHRPACNDAGASWQRQSLYAPPLGSPRFWDDRPTLRGYIQINRMLIDPLCGAVDLENTDPRSHTFASLSMWFGFTYMGGEKGMLKVGDRLTYTPGGGQRPYSFNILVSDRDYVSPDLNQAQSSHPDANGQLYNVVIQDGRHPWLGANGERLEGAIRYTQSLWINIGNGAGRRGTVDTNFTFQDHSVQRYNAVAYANDERMVDLPAFSNRATPNYHAPER